mmetsp:Transcript_6669/g.5005  ORF Transcript_6669/g.5005 Transcript_6669/m.5005 type:complete len:143 (-) Transcript_6669:251-679(-)
MNLLLSLVFLLTFLILRTRLKPLFLLLPSIDMVVSAGVLWDPFAFVTRVYLRYKVGSSIAFLMLNFAFVLFEPLLLDSKYAGQALSLYFISVKLIFDVVSCYYVWSFKVRKYRMLKVVPVTDAQEKLLKKLEQQADKEKHSF